MAESYSKMGEMPMPKKSNKPAKVLEHMKVMPATGGGAMVEHHFTHLDHPMESHVFSSGQAKEFAAHVMQHAGMNDIAKSEDVGDKEAEGNEPEA